MNLIKDRLIRVSKKYKFLRDFVFEGCQSMAIFFCAAFYGEHDAIYALTHNVPEVTLIDIDEEKMNEMKNIYPTNWEFITGDAPQIASRFLKEGKTFDIVTCDPWSPYTPKILNEYFVDFWKLANKYFMVGGCDLEYFYTPYNVSPDKESLEKYLLKLWNKKVKLEYMFKASSIGGGCYYMMFEGGSKK